MLEFHIHSHKDNLHSAVTSVSEYKILCVSEEAAETNLVPYYKAWIADSIISNGIQYLSVIWHNVWELTQIVIGVWKNWFSQMTEASNMQPFFTNEVHFFWN